MRGDGRRVTGVSELLLARKHDKLTPAVDRHDLTRVYNMQTAGMPITDSICMIVSETRYTFCSTERGFLPHCSCVYCAELATDLAKISLGPHSIEHL